MALDIGTTETSNLPHSVRLQQPERLQSPSLLFLGWIPVTNAVISPKQLYFIVIFFAKPVVSRQVALGDNS